jgi:hypothetical protein
MKLNKIIIMQHIGIHIKPFILSLLLCVSCNVIGQNNPTFNIISQFEPNVKNGVKSILNPEIPDSIPADLPLQFGIQPNPRIQYVQPETIAPATLKPHSDRFTPKALITVGLAPIYVMPILQFNYTSKPTRNSSADFNTNKDLPQGFANTDFSAYNTYHLKNISINTDVIYKRHTNRYFDVTDTFTKTVIENNQKSSIRQELQCISPQLHLQTHNADSFKINYSAFANYYIVQRNFTGSTEWEQSFKLNTIANRWINHEHVFADINLMYLKYAFYDSTNHNILGTLNPYFKTRGIYWQSRVGFKLAYSQYPNTSGLTYVYPDLQASYDVFPGWAALHLNVTGDLQRNSMYSLYQQNPFISNALILNNTTVPLLASIALNGKTWIKSDYELFASWTQLKNSPVFDRTLNNERYLFKPQYLSYALFTLKGFWQHRVNEIFKYDIKAEWYSYYVATGVKLQYLPDYSIHANAMYSYSAKLHLSCGVYVFGTQHFINYDTSQDPLKPWTDFNLSAEYQHSNILKYFFRMHNIMNQNTYRWQGYRQQNFNFVFGVSFNPLKS